MTGIDDVPRDYTANMHEFIAEIVREVRARLIREGGPEGLAAAAALDDAALAHGVDAVFQALHVRGYEVRRRDLTRAAAKGPAQC